MVTVEDGTTATSSCRSKLAEFVECPHRGFGYGVVAIDDAYLVAVDIVLLQTGCSQSVTCSHIRVLSLLGHELTEVSVHKRF